MNTNSTVVISAESIRHVDLAHEFLRHAAEHLRQASVSSSGEFSEHLTQVSRALTDFTRSCGEVVDCVNGTVAAEVPVVDNVVPLRSALESS